MVGKQQPCEHGLHPLTCLECLNDKPAAQLQDDLASYCRHSIKVERCVVCTPGLTGYLYCTGGGTHFHTTPACGSLAQGQEKVRRRGGVTEPIQPVHSLSGAIEGLDPCATCATRPRRPTPLVDRLPNPTGAASTLDRLKAEARRRGVPLSVVVEEHSKRTDRRKRTM